MKVKIKNYSNYFGSYKLADLLHLDHRFCDTWVGEKFDSLMSKYYEWKDSRRVSVKIDPWDTWNMDANLAYIIVPMLKQLKKEKQGAPFVKIKDRPEHLRPKPGHEQNSELDEYYFEAWDWVMDEMIFAFEAKTMDWEDQFQSGNIDITWEPAENGYSEMKHGPNHTFTVDTKARDEYQARITRGLELFGKYYEGLWD